MWVGVEETIVHDLRDVALSQAIAKLRCALFIGNGDLGN